MLQNLHCAPLVSSQPLGTTHCDIWYQVMVLLELAGGGVAQHGRLELVRLTLQQPLPSNQCLCLPCKVGS